MMIIVLHIANVRMMHESHLLVAPHGHRLPPIHIETPPAGEHQYPVRLLKEQGMHTASILYMTNHGNIAKTCWKNLYNLQ